MTKEDDKTAQEKNFVTTIFEMPCGARINFHQVEPDTEASAEFTENVASIEQALIDEAVEMYHIH